MSESNVAPATKSEPKLFAVFRNGFRVSNADYPSEFFAQDELNYWKRLLTNWPDGSKLNVRELRPWKARTVTSTKEENE